MSERNERKLVMCRRSSFGRSWTVTLSGVVGADRVGADMSKPGSTKAMEVVVRGDLADG